MGKKISVIIPVYNADKYLEECLDSILNQNYDNFEIICVDDGSTDSCLQILHRYQENYERIKVYTKKNGGLSSTRNYGMDRATGEYIYFFDDDDVLSDQEALSFMVKNMEENCLDILYFDGEAFFENEDIRLRNREYENKYASSHSYGIFEKGIDLFKEFIINNDLKVNVYLQCIRKEFVEKNNFRFQEEITFEDTLFFYQTILSADKTMHVKRNVVDRRIRDGSITQSKWNLYHLNSVLTICIECVEYLQKCDVCKYKDVIKQFIDVYKQMLSEVYFFRISKEERERVVELDLRKQIILQNILYEVNSGKYNFPHHLVPLNSNLVIYGAGHVGIEFYYETKKNPKYVSVKMVDIKGDEASADNMKVASPAELKNIEFDYIVIAVLNEGVAKKIGENLEAMGISKEKIIWDNYM